MKEQNSNLGGGGKGSLPSRPDNLFQALSVKPLFLIEGNLFGCVSTVLDLILFIILYTHKLNHGTLLLEINKVKVSLKFPKVKWSFWEASWAIHTSCHCIHRYFTKCWNSQEHASWNLPLPNAPNLNQSHFRCGWHVTDALFAQEGREEGK